MDDIVDINTLFGPQPAASTDLTVVSLLELMGKHRIRTACTLSTLGFLLDAGVHSGILAEAVSAAQPRPSWSIEVSRLLSTGAIDRAVQSLGADRLLFGTGAPSQPVASVLGAVLHADLTEDGRRQILGANAR